MEKTVDADGKRCKDGSVNNETKDRSLFYFLAVIILIPGLIYFYFVLQLAMPNLLYDVHNIQQKIIDKDIKVGDRPFANSDAETICIVYGGDIAKFMRTRDHELNFYSTYALLERFPDGMETVTQIYENYLILDPPMELCTDEPKMIIVKEIFREQNHMVIKIGLENGR